ncbi:hypothetical protein [Aeromonas sp.]|uniref:hypothetical protein n=1 Tax=Aeromonas sp. TaxID=647 RepID=UPI00258574AF|nr:hypothetical protein [Aeromonas sp.]MCX7132124.1 hypothetical protein [Aeromonas sp.]
MQNEAEQIDMVPEKKEPISAISLMKKYCPTAINNVLLKNSLNEATYEYLIAELAENALSSDVLGKPGSNLNLVVLEIEESLELETAMSRLKKAEVHFLESLESVRKLQSLRKREELENTNDIIRSIKIGISRFNILFVILLIAGLTWAALNLPKDALALVSAAIGGVSTHLLSERNAVLSMNKTSYNEGGKCRNCDENQ